MQRLHELEIDASFLSNLNLPSKPILKFSDPNYLQSSRSAIALTLLHNVLADKYLNGIYSELEDGIHSAFDNIALATQFATEVQGLKR